MTAEPSKDRKYASRIPVNEFDTGLLISTPEKLANAMAGLPGMGAVALPVLGVEGCELLLKSVEQLDFRACKPIVGKGDDAVSQDFSISLNFPDEVIIDNFSSAFERQINKAFELMAPQPEPTPYHFNDRAALVYEADSTGISPHRDLVCFEGIIAILTLKGQADFCVCADRNKLDSIRLSAEPGVMIIMRGNHYAGIAERPFHYVENVRSQRIGLGLRYNAKL